MNGKRYSHKYQGWAVIAQPMSNHKFLIDYKNYSQGEIIKKGIQGEWGYIYYKEQDETETKQWLTTEEFKHKFKEQK